ncbi:MAG TPA: S8 family peptidase [Candidatus Acidoferrum sp.]|nr:S8 family peptidase [Candidatus Acidoferrum sp.]
MRQPSSPRHMLSAFHRPLAALLAATGLALAGLPSIPALAASNQAHLDREVLKAMQAGRSINVIVVARGDLNVLEADLRRTGLKHTERVPIAHGVAVQLTAALIDHFRADANVARLIYDAPVRLTDTPFDPTALATVYPTVVDALPVWSNPLAPLTGQGIGIAVIDSGIASHPDLGNRLIVSQNFNPNVNGNDDAYGHGTAVAGIIAGDGTAGLGQYVGVAPQANLISLRVNDGTGGAPTSAIMNAILWAVINRNTYNIRVINLSLQASVQESYRTSPIDAAVEYAWLKGVVVVVAAGNSGPNSALYAPANDPYVITVGATDDQGTVASTDDTLAGFSSYGVTQDGFTKPDFVAPGKRIITTLAPNSNFALNYPSFMVGSQYIKLSGTSVAAPIVSGAVALYIESNPTVRPGQLKGVLLATANRLGFPGSGAGYPDALHAIAYVGLLGNADHGLDPNDYLKVLYMAAHSLTVLPVVSWDSVSWDSVSWDSVSWDSVSWDAVSWSN